MKNRCLRRVRQNNGSLILTAAISAAVVVILVGGMLTYVSNEYKLNIRSHKWTQSLALGEAGVDMAFTEFNNFYSAGSNGFSSSRGWREDDGVYSRSVDTFLNPQGENVGVIRAEVRRVGSLNPYIFSSGGCKLSASSTTYIYRGIECRLANSAQFPAGMVAKGGIDMNGNNVTTDSYNSLYTSKSTNGKYDSTKKQANGDIATNATITNSTISAGNANIYGTSYTGPSGSVSLGPTGVIGPTFTSPATTVAAAIAAGWVRNDFAASIPDVTLPSGAASWSSQGSILNSAALSAGSYQVTEISLNGNNTLTIDGNVKIYITGSAGIGLNGNGQIVINSGGSLTIYSAGNMDIGGNGIVNYNSTSGDSAALHAQFYGLDTCTSVNLHGNADWVGLVYAPYAALSLGGGGSSGEMSGAVVVNTIGMNGHVNFHYDEMLRTSGPNSSYNIASWKSYRYMSGTWVADN